MRVWLDDERLAPKGWERCYWPADVIALLASGVVAEVSLDHDLGDDSHGTGYDVLLWIEREVITNNFKPPIIHIHTANPTAYLRMVAARASITRHALHSDQSPSGSPNELLPGP